MLTAVLIAVVAAILYNTIWLIYTERQASAFDNGGSLADTVN